MSRIIGNSIKYSVCEQGADHSEKIENKIKEVVVVESILDSTDSGVIL